MNIKINERLSIELDTDDISIEEFIVNANLIKKLNNDIATINMSVNEIRASPKQKTKREYKTWSQELRDQFKKEYHACKTYEDRLAMADKWEMSFKKLGRTYYWLKEQPLVGVNKGYYYSDKDNLYIYNNWGSIRLEDMGKKLGRSVYAIEKQYYKLKNKWRK